MANIFTSNQVMHVLVAKATTGNSGADKAAKTDNVGTIGIHKDKDGILYFTHKGNGGLTRSDLMTHIESMKTTPASYMTTHRKDVLVTLNDAVVDTYVASAQDYILKLKFQNPMGMSPDHEYWKHGAVHSVANMTPSDFYFAMAKSIALNMSREAVKMVTPYVKVGDTYSSTSTYSVGAVA